MVDVYARRHARDFRSRLYRTLKPPDPFIRNPNEPLHFPLGHWNLYVGGAGSRPEGYVNLELFAQPGVNVVADAEQLPFDAGVFQSIECNAVLEDVRNPVRVMDELTRVLAHGGYLHVGTPFCHPFRQYPRDYRRYTLDGLKQLARAE